MPANWWYIPKCLFYCYVNWISTPNESHSFSFSVVDFWFPEMFYQFIHINIAGRRDNRWNPWNDKPLRRHGAKHHHLIFSINENPIIHKSNFFLLWKYCCARHSIEPWWRHLNEAMPLRWCLNEKLNSVLTHLEHTYTETHNVHTFLSLNSCATKRSNSLWSIVAAKFSLQFIRNVCHFRWLSRW